MTTATTIARLDVLSDWLENTFGSDYPRFTPEAWRGLAASALRLLDELGPEEESDV